MSVNVLCSAFRAWGVFYFILKVFIKYGHGREKEKEMDFIY